MASRINSLMDIGKRSMMNSQTALQTTAHNIGAKDVEGYSRQRVEFQTNEPVSSGKNRLGTGARQSAITRINNDFIERQIQSENTRLGLTKGRAENIQRVEDVFNEHMAKGLNQFVTEFFNAFRELSNSPESQATRDLVRSTASAVTNDFQRINRTLKGVQGDVDNQIAAQIQEVNSLSKEIAKMNESISSIEIGGGVANDERDRRDAALKKLGELVNVKYAEGKSGAINVTLGTSVVLVSHGEAATLKTAPTPADGIKRESNFDVIYEMAGMTMPKPITRLITAGQIGGAIEVRDELINGLLEKVDGLAYSIFETVNTVHSAGFNGYGGQAGTFFKFEGAQEMPADPTGRMPAHQRGFSVLDASQNIRLADAIHDDSWNIAAGAVPDAPADNRIANAISKLQFERVMSSGTTTFDDFYNGIVGELGVGAHKAYKDLDHQEAVVKQLKNVRESISGVNLDEEAIKMIEYQKTFDASAKLIKTSDEMFDTVLSLKR